MFKLSIEFTQKILFKFQRFSSCTWKKKKIWNWCLAVCGMFNITSIFFWTVITNTKYVLKLFWVYSHYVTSGRPKTGGTLYKSVEFVKPYGTVRVLEQRVSYFTLWLFPFKYLFKWKFLTKLSISWSPIWNTMNKYMCVHVNCFLWTFV